METENPQERAFLDFLEKKNIDKDSFRIQDQALYEKWKDLFSQVFEESFVMQQKFLINPVRRKYPLVQHLALKAKKE
jgi:hypothetical protein